MGLWSWFAAKPAEPEPVKPKKKICCACPETKLARDECTTLNGPEAPQCQKLIEAHKQCLRGEGFNVGLSACTSGDLGQASSAMNRQQRDKQSQFVGITGADSSTATRCLEAASWSVEAAIDYFYSNGMQPSRSASKRPDRDAIHRLFLKYKDEDDEDVVGVEGISQLCSDLGVEPDDIVVLVLSWHLGAEAMCEYSKKEFEEGLAELGCDSIDKLRAKLPTLRAEVQEAAKFRKIYQFAYLFSREKGQKIVQLDVALAMWDLLLPVTRWKHSEAWKDFLRTHHKRAVSRDTWNQLLDFILNTAPDFSNYDDSGAWPYLLDEFVEAQRKELQQQPPTNGMDTS